MDKNNIKEELDVLHSAVMAIEELLVKKGLVSLDELNSSIKRCNAECKSKRKQGKHLI